MTEKPEGGKSEVKLYQASRRKAGRLPKPKEPRKHRGFGGQNRRDSRDQDKRLPGRGEMRRKG